MRRSICTIDPIYAIAGDKKTWKFSYTPANLIPKNSKLIFEIQTSKRPIDWQLPQTDIKNKSNVIWMQLTNGKPIQANLTEDLKKKTADYEFILPRDIKSGEKILICMGSLQDNDKNANQTQLYTQRKKNFNIHIQINDKTETDTFNLDVKGAKLKILKIIVPSFVSRNKRFDVVVRFEDEYGNLTNNTEENTLIELSYQHLRESLNWKLFIPETGFITLPNLYFNEPGIYKIQLKNLKTNEIFYSTPIKCFEEYDYNLFWGLFHGENAKYDSSKHIDNCLRYCRDNLALQFFATSNFDAEEETLIDIWKNIASHIAEFNEDDRFTAFLGQQWLGNLQEEGLRQFVFLKDNKNILRKKDLKANSLKKMYKTFSSKDFLSIPSFTMGSSSIYNFKEFDNDFERVVEIYNAWGSSEMSSKEGNLRPISGPVQENEEGSIQKALLSGCRFGFVAGGLDDRGIYSNFYDTSQVQYSSGLTAIIAKNQTRESIFDALYNRSCYATTGAKILASFYIANEPMGSEISTIKKPGLVYNRYLSGFVIGTDIIKDIIIYRNNKVLTSFHPNTDSFDFSFDDFDPLEKVCIKPREDKPACIFYYLKIVQRDSHIAWISPIWIDLEKQKTIKKK